MKKNKVIMPVGLKGNEVSNRIKELMGIKTLNENKSNVVVELTKIGPDGNAYAIVRENREWYIKKAEYKNNLVAEDFKYIGGLQNKKLEAYPSYAKAIKHLNLKFGSLAEAYNYDGEINLFLNDNLLTESCGSPESIDEEELESTEPDVMEEEVEMTPEEMAIDEMISEMKKTLKKKS